MQISYNWIQELVPDLDKSPEEVAELLTMHAYETNVVSKWAIDEKVTVVRITKIEPHPNADRLRLATVTDGSQEVRVVCGAPNIEEGQIVPYSPPGTAVQNDDGSSFTIRTAKIRGVESPGMLNSLRELGLGADHSGIFVLPTDTALGTPLTAHLPNDTILEADITPNRAHDSLSHLGIAREIAALLRLKVAEPESTKLSSLSEEVDGFRVNIEDEASCPRYMGMVVSNIQSAETPLWIQARLLALGTRPINPVVDITNYVMFEIGNPSHAFDQKKLSGKNISVRKANDETITLLDGEIYTIPAEALVISSDSEAIAIAGVMGGASTEVDEETHDIFLEIANFLPFSIQQTSTALSLRTEAAARFLKGLDPNLVETAAKRLSYLLASVTQGEVKGIIDVYSRPRVADAIVFSPERTSQIAGVDIDETKIRFSLEQLRFTVEEVDSKSWRVIPPSDRLDIQGEHDVIEEVLRIVGHHAITPSLRLIEQSNPMPLPTPIYIREMIRDQLVVIGLTEVYNYSFKANSPIQIEFDDVEAVELLNPPTPEQAELRTNLLTGLFANLITNRTIFQRNARRKESALFEVGTIYFKGDSGKVPGVVEEMHVAGVVVGGVPSYDEILSAIADQFGIEGIMPTIIKKKRGIWADDAYELTLAGERLGYIGNINPKYIQQLKYTMPILAFELIVSVLIKHSKEVEHIPYTLEEIRSQKDTSVTFVPLSKYPSILRDISLLVSSDITVEQVQEVIERIGGSLVGDVDLFDEYVPENPSEKGLAFHIEYQDQTKTLTDGDVNPIHTSIIQALEAEVNAKIR